jgi:hypothetical protein
VTRNDDDDDDNNNNTGNITHHKKVLQAETWSLSGGVHHWLKRRSTREERKPVTRNDDDDDNDNDNNNNNNNNNNLGCRRILVSFMLRSLVISASDLLNTGYCDVISMTFLLFCTCTLSQTITVSFLAPLYSLFTVMLPLDSRSVQFYAYSCQSVLKQRNKPFWHLFDSEYWTTYVLSPLWLLSSWSGTYLHAPSHLRKAGYLLRRSSLHRRTFYFEYSLLSIWTCWYFLEQWLTIRSPVVTICTTLF